MARRYVDRELYALTATRSAVIGVDLGLKSGRGSHRSRTPDARLAPCHPRNSNSRAEETGDRPGGWCEKQLYALYDSVSISNPLGDDVSRAP